MDNDLSMVRAVYFLGLFCLFLLLVMGSTKAPAQSVVSVVNDSVVDRQVLHLGDPRFGAVSYSGSINGNSFQQDAVVSHLGYQYLAYYDGNRRVCIARRKLPTGVWEIIRFTDYIFETNNAHCSISLGICPGDGTIHLAFDQYHQILNYRISRRGVANKPDDQRWQADLFGPIRGYLEKGRTIRISYPRFWQTPQGGLQFGYRQGRSGNGQRMLVDYESSPAFGSTRQIDSAQGLYGASTSRSAYPNGYTYGPNGILHSTKCGVKAHNRPIMTSCMPLAATAAIIGLPIMA